VKDIVVEIEIRVSEICDIERKSAKTDAVFYKFYAREEIKNKVHDIKNYSKNRELNSSSYKNRSNYDRQYEKERGRYYSNRDNRYSDRRNKNKSGRTDKHKDELNTENLENIENHENRENSCNKSISNKSLTRERVRSRSRSE
jgi:hypothetical protein